MLTGFAPQNYKWQNRKVRILNRLFSKKDCRIEEWRKYGPGTPSDHPYSGPAWGIGVVRGCPGQYQSGQIYYSGRNAEQTPPPFPRVAKLCSNVAVEKDRGPPKIIGCEWPWGKIWWPWKVSKWPWFWVEVAVRACQDLATLLFPSMSNSSSLYTFFYSVIYNSVVAPHLINNLKESQIGHFNRILLCLLKKVYPYSFWYTLSQR